MIWKAAMYFSPRTIRGYVVVPTLSSLSECDISLQIIVFQTSFEIYQKTPTTEKPSEYKNCINSSGFFCHIIHSIRTGYECSQCSKTPSSSSFFN